MADLVRPGILFLFAVFLSVFLLKRKQTTPDVPKIVWSYWDSNPPKSVQQILENNQTTLRGWNCRFLNAKTLKNYLDIKQFPKEYNNLKPQHQADYIRLALLQQYGGVWLDSSIILNSEEELNRMRREMVATGSELAVFSLGEPEETYVENWFIMAPEKSSVVEDWFKEYDSAVRLGFLKYKKELYTRGIQINERIYKKDDDIVYLTQHACFQAVFQRATKVQRSRILLYKSEHSMFKLQLQCEWNNRCIQDRLKTDSKALRRLPFIKLRGEDRGDDLSDYFQQQK
jgi:hypothetical protein